jgi:hypothetical protein
MNPIIVISKTPNPYNKILLIDYFRTKPSENIGLLRSGTLMFSTAREKIY